MKNTDHWTLAMDVLDRDSSSLSQRERGCSSPATPLPFSIEKILSPDFGRGPLSAPANISKKFGPGNVENTAPKTLNQQIPGERGGNDILKHGDVPIWVYCTRFSSRASSGPRSRRIKKRESSDSKRPRTAFNSEQLQTLRQEFSENRYLTEQRRKKLSMSLNLSEGQVKIWFQNRRAKVKRSGRRSPLALQLEAHGLYNHSSVAVNNLQEDNKMLEDERHQSS